MEAHSVFSFPILLVSLQQKMRKGRGLDPLGAI